jgi:hypothetical protein
MPLHVQEMLSVDDFATLKPYPSQSDLSIFNLSPDFHLRSDPVPHFNDQISNETLVLTLPRPHFTSWGN